MYQNSGAMNSLIKVFFIILIFRGSTASVLSIASDLLSYTSAEVSSSLTSLVNATSNLSVSDCLNSLNITEEGILDVNGLIENLNLTSYVNITSIMSSLNVTISIEGGLLDVNSLLQNLNLTNVNFTSIVSLLNVNILNGALDFNSLAKKITSYANVTEFLNTLTVNESEDGRLEFLGLAEKYVNTAEEFNVVTEDGYILSLFHIKGNSSNVVLLSHGLFSSADDYILRGNLSLVYTLVNNGYDVWLINYRGNRYSRSHKTLDPDTDASFWQYSMHEMGLYDLSAVIDFVLNKTGETQLSVIGHSEGTATVFLLMSLKPEYNCKVKVFVALSPVCYLSHSGVALTTLIRSEKVVNGLLSAFGVEEVLGYEAVGRKLIQLLCSQGTVGYELCVKGGIAALAGYNPDNLEPEYFISVLGHYPAGSTRKNLEHYFQVGNQGRFAQYDYGTNNTEVYGSEKSPIYDLQNVTCPVSLFMGQNDKVLGLEDAERLNGELPNVIGYHVVDDKMFNHVDFLWGKNAPEVLHIDVLTALNTYN